MKGRKSGSKALWAWNRKSGLRLFALVALAVLEWGGANPRSASAQPVPPGTVTIQEDIKATRHNLSSTSQETGDITSSTSELCVFCHTPHGSSAAGSALQAPLWNRNLGYQSTQTYNLYDEAWSFSFEGTLNDTSKPTGYSRLCLSCHDDAIAIGSVINKPGSGGFMGDTPTADSLGVTVMSGQTRAAGGGVTSGDTRVLGTNLQNDHPISFAFDSTLATAIDAELVDPGSPPPNLNAVTPLAPAGGYKTGVKRYGSTADPATYDSVQCTSCHNPHAKTYPKFLRAPRLQDVGEKGFLPGGLPVADHPGGQIICLYCHAKPGWDNSTHDVSAAIHAAFPADDPGTVGYDETGYDFNGEHSVGAYACRNCHDPHTVQGAKRLHREGATAFAGSDAIENTCYLCHSPNTSANPLLPVADPTTGGNHRFCDQAQPSCTSTSAARIAPDIYSEFAKDSSNCVAPAGASPGSAMCLQLATGHEPVFISRSQEGVQLKSEGVALVPITNEETPGIGTIDVVHVECVDCHNPHQVNSPNLNSLAYNGAPNTNPPDAQGKGGRLKGIKGVGIDFTGTRPVVVSHCEPGFAICGTDVTINGTSANRDPYVYEVCFRCHGNSYTNIWGPVSGRQYRYPDDLSPLTLPDNWASIKTILFSPRSDPTNAQTGDQFSLKGFSNKWREFNPMTPDIETPAMLSADLARFGTVVFSHTQQTKNPAYHPVVVPGRNGSWQLCNQLATAFQLDCGGGAGNVVATPGIPGSAAAALSNLTIQCTDCHNNNAYDAFNGALTTTDSFGAEDTSGFRGPLTESNLRPTDVWPALDTQAPVVLYNDNSSGRPVKAIGPHGSKFRRILRANYDTDIMNSSRCFEEGNPVKTPACIKGDGYGGGGSGGHSIAGGGVGSDNTHFGKFLLCFNCHDRRGFDPDVAGAGGDQDRKWTRFFGLNNSTGVDSWWNGNLHMYHLRWTGAMCHECHYNVHSNNEAINTIYGDGKGGSLPPDGEDGLVDGVIGTHLINFGPTVEGTTAQKPMWFYDGAAFRCYLRCHNEVMDSCAYQATSTGTPNARWCAGGRNPGTSG